MLEELSPNDFFSYRSNSIYLFIHSQAVIEYSLCVRHCDSTGNTQINKMWMLSLGAHSLMKGQ